MTVGIASVLNHAMINSKLNLRGYSWTPCKSAKPLVRIQLSKVVNNTLRNEVFDNGSQATWIISQRQKTSLLVEWRSLIVNGIYSQ